jgi:hypothetical protein
MWKRISSTCTLCQLVGIEEWKSILSISLEFLKVGGYGFPQPCVNPWNSHLFLSALVHPEFGMPALVVWLIVQTRNPCTSMMNHGLRALLRNLPWKYVVRIPRSFILTSIHLFFIFTLPCHPAPVCHSSTVRFQIEDAAFWDIAPCSLVQVGRLLLKRRSTSARLYGAISQKALIFTSVPTIGHEIFLLYPFQFFTY